jgi:hypothetical protein
MLWKDAERQLKQRFHMSWRSVLAHKLWHARCQRIKWMLSKLKQRKDRRLWAEALAWARGRGNVCGCGRAIGHPTWWICEICDKIKLEAQDMMAEKLTDDDYIH